MRVVCGEVEEFPFEQTTSFGKKNALAPSIPHAGSSARAQNASPIPRSDADNIVAANGQATRLLCCDGCRLAAAMADIWFELDTGENPGWRIMKSSRPAIADRDGPALLVRRVTPNTMPSRLADMARSAENLFDAQERRAFPRQSR
ncbi:hypothetical protein CP49_31130 [Bradyrhizobium valentinum]|uniref:Uncharacterized protein n=1 Tax=Bradyrhizobium valentinum TaxID=1518501 RepID=A0A0R3KZW1_9BRAD|nr:hypothetical protein CP49_31130 [Bradyrhizobium valentinum]